MPSLQMPLRHQVSQSDGLRHQGIHPSDPSIHNKQSPKRQPKFTIGAYDKIFPSTIHDFQEYPTRRPAVNGSNTAPPRTSSKLDPPSPLPADQPSSTNIPEIAVRNGVVPSIRPRAKVRGRSRSPSPVSRMSSDATHETQATSSELPPLQAQSAIEDTDLMEPLTGDPAGSYDLVAPPEADNHQGFSLETRSEQLFSRAHLEIIFSNPSSLLRFTAFLSAHKPHSVPILIYYLDALKALKAIKYANAIAEALSPIQGYDFTADLARSTSNQELEEKAALAFEVLTQEDLPAFVTHNYVHIVSLSISQRITGTLAPHLREASEGLAEVFCLTDPSRPDNPIVFASEEFHRTTQYGMNYAIGRNCRFLQGPKTHPRSGRRIGDAITAGNEHCEVLLNYRRDGSPFMNMLMIAPLCDSKGKIRYFIGAQVDVTGLVKDCTDLESLQQLVNRQGSPFSTVAGNSAQDEHETKDDFQDLSEMLNMAELETVRKHGGRMHREYQDEEASNTHSTAPHMPRLLLQEPALNDDTIHDHGTRQSGKLIGIYQNYLLIRPYPSFRILFASPTLRVPGILQSPFMDKIGGSSRVRDELATALAEGRGVTAKVRWVFKAHEDGRNRWIHCTPLLGSNGQIGVWMVVLVDDDQQISRRWKQAPPVAPHRGRIYGPTRENQDRTQSSAESVPAGRGSRRDSLSHGTIIATRDGSLGSGSPVSVQI